MDRRYIIHVARSLFHLNLQLLLPFLYENGRKAFGLAYAVCP